MATGFANSSTSILLATSLVGTLRLSGDGNVLRVLFPPVDVATGNDQSGIIVIDVTGKTDSSISYRGVYFSPSDRPQFLALPIPAGTISFRWFAPPGSSAQNATAYVSVGNMG